MRITPDPREPVRSTLQGEGDGPAAEVRVHNLSELGIGVSLESALEAGFADVVTVHVNMTLPGVRHPVELRARIRYRRLVGKRIHYGLEFDAESPDFARQQQVITRFLQKREKRLQKRDRKKCA